MSNQFLNSLIQSLIKLGIIAGMIVSLVSFIHFGAASLFTEPEYDDFCDTDTKYHLAMDEASCSELEGEWNPERIQPIPAQTFEGEILTVEPLSAGYCHGDFTDCGERYDEARDTYRSSTSLIAIAGSLLTFVIGMLFIANPIISNGLIWSGVFSLLISVADFPKNNRLLLALTAFAIFIVLTATTHKKFSSTEK